MLKLTQIKIYNELRRQPLESYFLGVCEKFHMVRAFKIIEIDSEFVYIFSIYAGVFSSLSFDGSQPSWSYYKITSNNHSFLAYVNLFER